jgi:hypothetical protein
MRRSALAFLFALLPAVSAAQSEERVIKPEIRKGDSWTYRGRNVLENGDHTYELRVEKSDGKTILAVATRRGDEKEFDATFTAEWNPVVGVSGLIFSPPPAFFSYPMKVGDKRTLTYISSRPRGNVPPTQYESEVKVAGWEDVTVPAGKFRALKLVVEGVFFPPFSRGPAKLRIEYWYSPQVRRWVKLHVDWPSSETREELLEYKLNED